MASSSRSSLVEGPLSKWTNVVSGWQYRWFVLDQNSGLLSYYTSKDKMTRGSRRGCIKLKKALMGIDDEDECTFTLHSEGRTFHFQTQNGEERDRWVQALDSTIRRLKQPLQRLDLPKAKKGLNMAHRLAICESYYALLNEQIQGLSDIMNNSEEAESIKQTAANMLTAMKQCIDIMKDEQLTDSGSPSSFFTATSTSRNEEELTLNNQQDDSSSRESLIDQEIEGETKDDEVGDSDSVNSEDFYDAEEEAHSPIVTSPSLAIPVAEGDPSDIEDDEEYDEQDDTSSGVAANKSMIMYMLGQVRVGMDLSRVTLPTFILEKRSLLEMYADFLAHPDLFINITDYETPKERMVATVRYILSSFHAARKGTVAKKPYNPILGEVFRCYWHLPNGQRNPPDEKSKRVLESGPVPYATYDSVTFIAEQVSHHPPVSGFYAECPTKRMYTTGSIYTKSKFLGLSLGVHNIGKVTLTLMDHDEVYEATLPNAYGRSILTYPWMELGGKCTVKCIQTGYHANLEFHCKPFYGGRKHRVTAEIFDDTDRKPFMKVEGEWNGVMNIKHPNGDEEVFVDTLHMPTIRKKLRNIDRQEPNESKRQWRDVTIALQNQDEQAATDAKHKLEEQQRSDARERAEQGIEWQQKHFDSDGETWWYKSTLSQRLAEQQTSLEEQ